VTAHPDLVSYNAQFRKQVIALALGICRAVGYAPTNADFPVGPQGVAVTCTTDSTGAARNSSVTTVRDLATD